MIAITATIIPAATARSPTSGVGVARDGEREFPLRYRPDFSMLETESTMTVTTRNQRQFHFFLTARIPNEHIAACREAIPRPAWESPCRRVIMIMMVVLIVGITLMGYIEANYIVEPWLVQGRKPPPTALTENGYELLGRMYPEYLKPGFHKVHNTII